MKRIFFVISIVVSAISSSAQDTVFVRNTIQKLSSQEMYGRGYSYNGDSVAASFLRNELIEIGVKPLCEDYYQDYNFYVHKMEGEVSFAIDDKNIDPHGGYSIAPYSKSLDGTFTIVHLPLQYIINDEATTYLSENYNVQNNFLVYIDAEDYDKDNKSEDEKVKAFFKSITTQNPLNSSGYIIGRDNLPVWGFSKTDYERNHAVIYVDRQYVDSSSKTAKIKFTNTFYYHKTQNVCGYIEGNGDTDSLIVFTAHYDHLGTMGDELMFPGAHDNASGVAMILDFARYYCENNPHYNTLFLFFSGEEAGLRGSTFFVDNTPVDLEKIKVLFNLDLLCGGDDGITLVNSTSDETSFYYDRMVKLNDEKGYLKTIRKRENAANSDHFPFSKYCPAIFIYTMGGKTGNYHSYDDTCENCGLENYYSIFDLILYAIE